MIVRLDGESGFSLGTRPAKIFQLRCINRVGRLADGVLERLSPMSVFKRRRFPTEIILLCVRWYCRYGISYRDLEEMMAERGVAVDHVTLYRWVQRYAPELEKLVRWYQGYRSSSWRVDETYVQVGWGKRDEGVACTSMLISRDS